MALDLADLEDDGEGLHVRAHGLFGSRELQRESSGATRGTVGLAPDAVASPRVRSARELLDRGGGSVAPFLRIEIEQISSWQA